MCDYDSIKPIKVKIDSSTLWKHESTLEILNAEGVLNGLVTIKFIN